MKLVLYSSNPTAFASKDMHHYNFPGNTSFWKIFLNEHSNIDLVFVTQLPGMFLLDYYNEKLSDSDSRILYKILPQSAKKEDFIQIISSFTPDLVIACSFWLPPFDYLPVEDSIIGEQLQQKGFKVYCQPLETSLICFDKNKTHNVLKSKGFNVAKAVYVNHELFWAERNRKEVINNVYKESVFYEIEQLKLPVIIKDTCGLSSFGMEVCRTFGEVRNFLNSKKNNSDRIVEEFLDGQQFGLELSVFDDKVKIDDPFMFSVNQYGITSPKQSVKIGPVLNSKYKIHELKKEIERLVNELKIQGFAQIDLVFHENKWYIIEINPRLSGMTELTRAAEKNPGQELIAIKFPILTKEQLNQFTHLPYLLHLNQIVNDAALQRREQGYCEVIIPLENLEDIKKDFPDLIEQAFYQKALELKSQL